MNVLCICYEYPPIGGGGAPVCQGIAEAVVAADHHVDVVTSAMSDLPAREVRNGVNIYRHPVVRRHRHYTNTTELLTGILPAYRYAMMLARRRSYDLIHCHFILPSGIVARMVSHSTGLPYLITAHGSDVPGYNPDRFSVMHKLIRPVWRHVVSRASVINTPSQFLRELIRSKIDVDVEIIPYGYRPPPPPKVLRLNRVLIVTRMFERKGVQHVLDAMVNMDTDWELCIVGDGPYLPALRAKAAQLGVDARFYGYVQGQALTDLYHSARIFVLPSSAENFPVVLLEAMAAGLAVITTAGTGCAEVVGPAAILIERDSPEGIAVALRRLMNDADEIERFSQLSLQRIRRFDWPRIGDEFVRLYQRQVGAGAATGTILP